MNIWGILLIIGIILVILGAIGLILSNNASVRKIGGLFLGIGIIIFIVGAIGSYTLLSATSKTIGNDKNYRRRAQEEEEGDENAVAKTFVIS